MLPFTNSDMLNIFDTRLASVPVVDLGYSIYEGNSGPEIQCKHL
jgi:hypothetical protein